MALITIDPVTGAIGNDTKPLPDELQAQVSIAAVLLLCLPFISPRPVLALLSSGADARTQGSRCFRHAEPAPPCPAALGAASFGRH